jgi:hypothetical protein
MSSHQSDTSSESEKEEVAVVPKQKKKFNAKANITDQTETITIDPELIGKIKLHKVQVRQLKKLQAEALNGPKPIDPVKEAKKEEAKQKRLAAKAEKDKEKAEKERLAKILEDEAKKVAELKSKYITFKVPIYKYIKKDKVAKEAVKEAVKESIEADEGDNDVTSEEEKPKERKPRQRRFQKEKVELDTSDEERVAKLESIDKALNQFAFAPRRRRFF